MCKMRSQMKLHEIMWEMEWTFGDGGLKFGKGQVYSGFGYWEILHIPSARKTLLTTLIAWNEEQAFSWLYFCTLYCNGFYISFTCWFCGTEPFSSVAIPVSKYKGRKDVSNLECSYSSHHLSTLHKCLGRQGWRNSDVS